MALRRQETPDTKEPYRGFSPAEHDCEGGFCHGCLAHFMTWRDDPRPERDSGASEGQHD